jgi:uncharacterized protein (DUF2344 family)
VKIDKDGTSFLFIVKIKIQLQHYKYENKINITSEIISPLEILSSFKNKSNKEYLLYLSKQKYEDAINHARKEKKSFG